MRVQVPPMPRNRLNGRTLVFDTKNKGSTPFSCKKGGNSLMVERYIVTIKMWVQIPFITIFYNILYVA